MDQHGVALARISALLLASAALMGSPGPSTVSMTAVGAAFGLRRSLPYALGLIVGTCLVLLVVATGVFTVLRSVPSLAPVLTAASAAYIVYLAIRIARAPPIRQHDPDSTAPSLMGGLLLAAAHPKAYVAIAAVFAGSRLDGFPPATEALVKTALLAFMVVLIHFGWLVAGASLSGALRDPLASRIVNLALAVVLVITNVLAVLPR
ncbi:MAG: LysE family translocator [Geminicoccaceae bacterium]